MRRERSFRRNWKLAVHPPPAKSYTDGVVTVRLPTGADAWLLESYAADPDLLDGLWVGYPPKETKLRAWARACVRGWLAGWTEQGSDQGPAFIVDERDPFVEIVNLVPRTNCTLELLYGVLPPARGRRVASRAVQLAAAWVLGESHFTNLEIRVGEANFVSQHVAENAGFQLVERYETFVTGTGQTHIDLRYTKSNN